MKHQSYFTRALQANDRRFARIFGKLGYQTADLVAEDTAPTIQELRDAYEKVFGKRPFNGWDAETLAAKIEEKRAEG